MDIRSDESELKHVRHVYRSMLTARVLENKLGSLYKAGKIVGGVYLGKGQEAISASLAACLNPGQDVYAPLIRDQAGRTAFGEDLLDCTRSYLGSVLGPMRGRDGNIHRGRPADGVVAMISHLGASISVVSGMLLAKRLKGVMDGVVGVASIGDGCTSTGSFHEGVNVAAVEHLPLVLLVTNNQYAYSTPNNRQFACSNLVDKANGYGIRGHRVDGTDMLACVEVTRNAVARARAGEGPQLVVAEMLRLTGHGEHDDFFYVDDTIKSSPLGRDGLDAAREQMVLGGFATEDEMSEWEVEATDAVQQAVAQAQKEPEPDPYQDDWNALSNTISKNDYNQNQD